MCLCTASVIEITLFVLLRLPRALKEATWESSITKATVIIKSGQTTSAPFYLGAKKPYAMQMPAAFTGATVTFLGSFDNITYEADLRGRRI